MSEIPLLFFLRQSRYPEGPLIDPLLNSCLNAPEGHRIAGAHHVNDRSELAPTSHRELWTLDFWLKSACG